METMYPPQNNSPIARTSGTISSSATTITVNDGSILPAAPNVLTLGTGEDAELVLMTAKASNILTVERGFNSTTAKEWPGGTAIYRAITAQDISALQENVQNSPVHLTTAVSSGAPSASVTVTFDETYATIRAAYDAGKMVYLKIRYGTTNYYYMPATLATSTAIRFTVLTGSGNYAWSIVLKNDDTVSVTLTQLA